MVVPPRGSPARLAPAAYEARRKPIVARAPADGSRSSTHSPARSPSRCSAITSGFTDPPNDDLRVWATRLFEFQFADAGNDPSLRVEVDRIAPALRAHIDRLIGGRRATPVAKDDVLGRCLAFQAQGRPGFERRPDTQRADRLPRGWPASTADGRAARLEQLLRRPRELSAAAAAGSRRRRPPPGSVTSSRRFGSIRWRPALTRKAQPDAG